jgi:hypothetical protein
MLVPVLSIQYAVLFFYLYFYLLLLFWLYLIPMGRRGRDRTVIGFITTYEYVSINTNVVSLNTSQARCT